MNLPFEAFVATRYLLAKRKQAFISVISGISILGVTVGVMALLIALGLMTGLQGQLRDRIIGSSAQVYVFKVGGFSDIMPELAKFKTLPHVTGVAPAVLGKALASNGPDQQAFVSVKGVDPAMEPTVTDIGRAMRSGSLAAIHSAPDQTDGIVLGADLASSIQVQVGDTIRLTLPNDILTPLGPMQHTHLFKVVGIFSLGLYEFDSEYAFVDLPVAQNLFRDNTQEFVQLRLDDPFDAKGVAAAIPKQLGDQYLTQDWADMNKSLFSALWLEKMAIAITIGLIVMVGALNIVASLVLLVMEKNRDIAILKTMGTSATSIRRIFMLQGLIIGVVGTAVGSAAGILVDWILDHFHLIHVPIDVYQISYVPFTLLPLDAAVVIVSAVVLCFVATIYPSRQAAKLDPAQALRYQ